MQQILETLPHRYPFLLVDKVIDVNVEEKTVVALKNVTYNEWFFQGHFPNNPIMPGFLILEALAQASWCLASKDKKVDLNSFVLVGVDNARFRKAVIPGDQLILNTKLVFWGGGICRVEAHATVNREVVAEAIITSAMVSK